MLAGSWEHQRIGEEGTFTSRSRLTVCLYVCVFLLDGGGFLQRITLTAIILATI